MPGTLRGDEPVATMISRRLERLLLALDDVDASLAGERRRPLDPVDLVLLEQELDALGQAGDDLVLARVHLAMSIAGRPAGIATPHSFAFWTIFSAWACSSSALVGMHPQMRQVPPSAFCFSTTATFLPSWTRGWRQHSRPYPRRSRRHRRKRALTGRLPGSTRRTS